jgi:hypothetical protein
MAGKTEVRGRCGGVPAGSPKGAHFGRRVEASQGSPWTAFPTPARTTPSGKRPFPRRSGRCGQGVPSIKNVLLSSNFLERWVCTGGGNGGGCGNPSWPRARLPRIQRAVCECHTGVLYRHVWGVPAGMPRWTSKCLAPPIHCFIGAKRHVTAFGVAARLAGRPQGVRPAG